MKLQESRNEANRAPPSVKEASSGGGGTVYICTRASISQFAVRKATAKSSTVPVQSLIALPLTFRYISVDSFRPAPESVN